MVRLRYNSVVFVFFALILCSLSAAAQSPDEENGPPADPSFAPAASTPAKRIFGVLPNYRTADGSAPFSPLSAKQKLNIARHDSFDWPSYVLAAGLVFISPGNEHDPFGTGITGYANRYVRNASDQIVGNMLREGFLPALLGQDPRYFRRGSDYSFRSRLGSALGQMVVARNDSGHRIFNISEFLGNAMATGISNAYSPNLNSWPEREQKLALMVSTDALSNVMKEFGPDLRQLLSHLVHEKK